jgi:phenylalanyl-tRNA synthetase beta chain
VAQLTQFIQDLEYKTLVATGFVGSYEGEGIREGKRSVTLRLDYRASGRTLRDEEIDKMHLALVSALVIKFKAEIR